MQQPEGLKFSRHFWFDEDGSSLTYRDDVRGKMQRIWRLDAQPSHRLGSVRVNDKSQLITSNPVTGADGVEIRERNLELQAIGRR